MHILNVKKNPLYEGGRLFYRYIRLMLTNCHAAHGGGKQLLYPVDILRKKFSLFISWTIASATYMPRLYRRNFEKMAGDEASLMTSIVYWFSPDFPEGDGVSFRGYDGLLERESTVCKVNHEVSANVWKILASSRFDKHLSVRAMWLAAAFIRTSYTISRGSITLREFLVIKAR